MGARRSCSWSRPILTRGLTPPVSSEKAQGRNSLLLVDDCSALEHRVMIPVIGDIGEWSRLGENLG